MTTGYPTILDWWKSCASWIYFGFFNIFFLLLSYISTKKWFQFFFLWQKCDGTHIQALMKSNKQGFSSIFFLWANFSDGPLTFQFQFFFKMIKSIPIEKVKGYGGNTVNTIQSNTFFQYFFLKKRTSSFLTSINFWLLKFFLTFISSLVPRNF